MEEEVKYCLVCDTNIPVKDKDICIKCIKKEEKKKRMVCSCDVGNFLHGTGSKRCI